MTKISPQFKSLSGPDELNEIIEFSRKKPVLVFKHLPTSEVSNAKKSELEREWSFPGDEVVPYLVTDDYLSETIADMADIPNEFPQIVLFADGVTMYDETGEMISIKKIRLALKIVYRTFKWMETRA